MKPSDGLLPTTGWPFPPIPDGSLLSPCWLQADVPRVQMQICHGRACPRGTDHLLCFHQSTSEQELQRVPAASLQKQNNFTSQFYRDTNFIESGEWTQFYLNYFVFPFFCLYLFFILCCSTSLLFFPTVFAPPLPTLSLTDSPSPVTFVFKCSNLPFSRGLRSRVNKFASVFSMQLNCTFTVDILI